ncbi:cyclin-dependent kinase 4-like [Cimex lectularius]|uniref:cyclin-dependent kinase n=1 Tax=Cimex lectularius TaxID=79782 RepID=A0A8I6RPE0_CIMLE|nr:cyclin-dependent kinase 4-like [Cimex lectularius]XP_014245799.1 cyclin-dependent kinase 4-like [Cimex lectularius]
MKTMPGPFLSGFDFGMLHVTTAPDHYVELNVIGNGAYGTVYKARRRGDPNSVVAMKKIKVPLLDEGLPLSTLREIATLKHLDQYEHPNIIRLLDICHGKRMEKQLVLYLIFEHVEQDLSTYMQRCPPPGLPSCKVKNLMRQILCGIDFLHSHRILHRDLKPQNLLITNNDQVKLADFGLAKTYDFDMRLTSVVVTLWYRSPEVLLGCPYATPVDIWSVGCIMAEMIKGSPWSPLFDGTSEGDQLAKIFSIIGTPREEAWPEDVSISLSSFIVQPAVDMQTVIPNICSKGKDLLEKMLKFNPQDRICAADAIRHDYFTENEPSPSEMVAHVASQTNLEN